MTIIKTDIMETKTLEYITEHTITDKEAVRIAKCMPKSVPESFLKPLVPVGTAKFKGDEMPENWSANPHFTKGETYPIYDSENGYYPISQLDGMGMKMTHTAWSRITFFDL